MVKELVHIVITAALWGWVLRMGQVWRAKTGMVEPCDYEAVVAIINRWSSRNLEAPHLMQCLVFMPDKLKFDF